jgi:hypothetical protein
MIVYRIEYKVKLGQANAAMELMKWSRGQLGPLAGDRYFYNKLGEGGNRIAVEKEFESLADFDKWLAEYSAALAELMEEMKAKGLFESFAAANYKEIWELF